MPRSVWKRYPIAKIYVLNTPRRVLNGLLKTLLTFGLGPIQSRLLSVKGRKSGRVYSTPVNLVHREGTDYLVSPYGNVSWTRNARAAHSVSLRRGGREQNFMIEE